MVAAVLGPVLNQLNLHNQQREIWNSRKDREKDYRKFDAEPGKWQPLQWTLSEHESSTTLENWKTHLMCTPRGAPYPLKRYSHLSYNLMLPGEKKTKNCPFSGFTEPDASAKTTILELLLLRIAMFAPVLSHHTIVSLLTLYEKHYFCAMESTVAVIQLSACLSQSSTLHQPSYRPCSEPSQTVLPTLETLQAHIDS